MLNVVPEMKTKLTRLAALLLPPQQLLQFPLC